MRLHNSFFAAVLLFFVIATYGQVNRTQDLMPVPQQLKTSGQRFGITEKFRVAVTGHPDQRVYAEASRFIRRLGEKTGLFLDKQ